MKKIHKLVVSSAIGPLVITFVVSMLVLLMQFIWKYVDDLVGKGLDAWVIVKFLYYAALTLVPMALPLSVLIASIMTFGNLGERYEIVASKAAGISLSKMMRPLIVGSIAIAALCFVFSNNVHPYAFLKYRTLLFDIQTKKPALNIKEGEYYDRIEGYVIRIGKKHSDGMNIEDIQMFDHTENRAQFRMSIAKKGKMQHSSDGKYLVFTLYDGYSYAEEGRSLEERKNYPFSTIRFDEQQFKFDLSSFDFSQSDGSLFKSHEKMLPMKELQLNIDTLEEKLHERLRDVSQTLMARQFFYSTYFNDSIKVTGFCPDGYKQPGDLTLSIAKNQSEGYASDVTYYGKDIRNQRINIAYYRVEWHRKLTLPVACMIFLLIGAPLGAIIRRGGFGMPIVISVLLFIAYYQVSIIGEKSARQGELTCFEGMWLSALVFVPIGIFLTYKAISDAPLLDSEVWRRRFNKLFRRS